MTLTIQQALTSTVNFALPDNRVAKALIDANLDGDEAYSRGDEQAVDLCMAGLLLTLITSADVTEDDVSVKLPSRDVLMKVCAALYVKWGQPNPFVTPVMVTPVAKPTVRQVRVW